MLNKTHNEEVYYIFLYFADETFSNKMSHSIDHLQYTLEKQKQF